MLKYSILENEPKFLTNFIVLYEFRNQTLFYSYKISKAYKI